MKALLNTGYMEMMVIIKADLEEMKYVAEHQEVPKEDATVETIGALEDQYGDWP
jgi:hypothetical protein